MSRDEEIADLRRELAEVKAKVAGPPPLPSEQSTREWRSDQHAARERRMNFASPPLSAEERKAMEAACPPSVAQDIRAKGSIPGPTGMVPVGQEVGAVHSAPGIPGSARGWIAPIGPPPGINYVDQQLDAQDRRDKAERIAQEARLRATK
jgi:hypothetical protein